MKRIGLDIGYRGTKGLNSDGNIFHEPSVVGVQTASTYSLRGDGPFSIQIDGQKQPWYIGRSALEQSEYSGGRRDSDWIFSTHYRALFYAALSELCRGSSHATVNLVTGLPMQDYDRLALRARDEVFLGKHTFLRGGRDWQTVTVEDCYCVTQPFGSLADQAMTDDGGFRDNAFANGVAAVADIGGNTFNLLVTREMEEIGRWSAGDGLGLLGALEAIAKDIRNKYPGFDPKVHEVAEWVAVTKFPYGTEKIDIMPLATPHLSPLTELIISRMATVWREPKRLEAVLLTGGSSMILGELLKAKMNNVYSNVTIAKDAIFANARGYLKLTYYFWPDVLADVLADIRTIEG